MPEKIVNCGYDPRPAAQQPREVDCTSPPPEPAEPAEQIEKRAERMLQLLDMAAQAPEPAKIKHTPNRR